MKLKTIYTRPRVDKLLGRCMDYPLTSVVAGAGYGKTTAAKEYLKKAGVPYAYVTLTGSNGDIFWDKLCAAAEAYRKSVADALRIQGLPVGAKGKLDAIRLAKTFGLL